MCEFLWSEDMADACVFIMERVDFDDIVRMNRAWGEVRNVHLNIGTGEEVSIRGLAELIAETVGFGGRLRFNADRPDGTLRKLTDPGRLQGLGWRHRVGQVTSEAHSNGSLYCFGRLRPKMLAIPHNTIEIMHHHQSYVADRAALALVFGTCLREAVAIFQHLAISCQKCQSYLFLIGLLLMWSLCFPDLILFVQGQSPAY